MKGRSWWLLAASMLVCVLAARVVWLGWLTFFFISPQLEGSRYLCLAECGWALLAADLIVAVTGRLPWRSLAFGCALASAVLVSVLSVAREVGVWTRAADLRDRVLADARAAIARQGCVEATFVGVPDSVDGAYVFRNGFQEAMEPVIGSAKAGHDVEE